MPRLLPAPAGVLLAMALGATSACGQAFPLRPVKLVVGFTPGGGVDINARMLAGKLTEILGQSVLVENKPGAGTNIANEFVAKAVPDGYTLLINTAAVAINMSLYRNVPFDTLRDFAPVAVFSESQNIMLTSAPATTALIAGEVDLVFINVPAILPHVKSGRLRALAAAGAIGRAARSPDIRQKLLDQGAEPVGSTPEEFGALLKEEVTKWREVVRASGLKAE